MSYFGRRSLVACSVSILVAMASISCGSGPTQPTTPPSTSTRELTHFEEIVGTSWVGTARFSTGGGQSTTLPVSLVFLWGGVCDVPGWCAEGYSPFGWGTTDGIPTRIRGYNDRFVAGVYNRHLNVGENPALGEGNWDSARLSGDRQHLVISSTDFSWDDRRAVTFELSRAPWPPDVICPRFTTCGSW